MKWVKLWLLIKPIKRFRNWRQRRKETPMLEGKKTYIAAAGSFLTMVLMWFNIGTAEDAQMLIDGAVKVITAVTGLLSVGGVIYGRWDAARRAKKSQ